MRIPIGIIFLFIFSVSYSRENSDTSRTRLRAEAIVSLNSNGIASIPAFSLDDPAIIATISLAKGRFSYDPTLAYGLDLRPWYIDNWLHYKLIVKPSFELRTGFNISSFFSEYKVSDEEIHQSQRYYALSIDATYKITPGSYLSLTYWNDRGQDKGTLKGHFVDLTGEKSDISVGKTVLLSVNLQLFYINYDGNNDGLFVSPKISSSLRNIPFSLYFQATQAIISNIEPFPGFRWNLGLGYKF